MTKFSVVVPTYKREEELKRALESIASQTYEDFELIVVDDNPKEENRRKVRTIVEELEGLDVNLLVNDDKQGVSSARNLGIENSSGEFVAFLDDDDEWKPKKLEKEAEKLGAEEDCDAVYSTIEMYSEGEIQDVVRREENMSLEKELQRDRIGSPSRVTIRKEIIQAVDGFDEDIPSGEDWDIWIRLLANGTDFCYIEKPLVRYHQSEDSKSNQIDVATEGREKITEKHSELLNRAGKSVKARHHLNRAKKQYQLGDFSGSIFHLKKTFLNNPLEFEAYAMLIIIIFRKISGKDLIPLAVKVKRWII